MDVIYSIGGKPLQRDGDHLWDRDGRYVGRFVDERVFSPSGAYLGELRLDRLAYKQTHGSKRQGTRSARSNRSGTSRSDRSGRSIPSGWEEFHGGT